MKMTNKLLSAVLLGLLLVTQSRAQKVVEVEVHGELNKVAESLIRSTIGLAAGVELSQENVQAAVRDLQGLNVFEDIQIWGERVTGGIKVIVVVEEYPTLEGIRFKGNKHVKDKDMKESLAFVAGQVIAPKDIARGTQKIVDLCQDKGYLRAEVVGQLFDAEDEGKVYLQYTIDEGEKVKIKRIRILNADAISEGKVKKQIETKEKRWWRKGEYKADTYRDDKDKILAFYKSKGYYQAEIVRDSVYYDGSRKNLFIDIEVEEGQKYRMGELAWDGNVLFGNEVLAAKLPMEEGDVYKFSGPELSYLVRTAYLDKGYLDTEVIPQETLRGDSVDVVFKVFEGEPWKIRRINIKGNTKTREKVIRRELELRPGDIYQQDLVQESQRRVYMLNFFKDVQIEPEFGSTDSDRLVDLNFQVEEQPTGQASMGAGYSQRDKLVGQIGLRIPNFRGMGQNLDFSWEFGTRRKQFLIGFTEPWLLDTPTSLSVRAFILNQQYFNLYDRQSKSLSVRIGRRLERLSYSSLSIGYRLQTDSYNDFSDSISESMVASGRYETRRTSSFELTYQRDTRDLAQFPTSGTLFSFRPEIASSFAGGEVDFHSHEIRFNYYRPSWWKFILSIETKMSIIDGFTDWDDDHLSFFDLFTPGGIDWWDGVVRGYPDRSLGPRSGGIPLGGRSMMILNLEYRFPVAQNQVFGLLFADAGNAWSDIEGMSPLDLRRSAGFGFRIMTPMLGMIGFDFGYGFDRRKVDNNPAGWNTHFQFGPQFF